jgi:hypothetical protein
MFEYVSIIKISFHVGFAHLTFLFFVFVLLFFNYIILFYFIWKLYLDLFLLAFVFMDIHVFDTTLACLALSFWHFHAYYFFQSLSNTLIKINNLFKISILIKIINDLL